jgi:hypothetical protein
MFPIALTSRTTWMPPNPSPWRWRKEGATVDRQRRDQAECAMASDPMHGGPRRHREQSQSSRPWSSVQADRLVRRRALCISSSANTRSHTPENMVNGRYQKRMGITVLAAKKSPVGFTRAQCTVSRYYSPHGVHLLFSVALPAGPFLNWGWPPSSHLLRTSDQSADGSQVRIPGLASPAGQVAAPADDLAGRCVPAWSQLDAGDRPVLGRLQTRFSRPSDWDSSR